MSPFNMLLFTMVILGCFCSGHSAEHETVRFNEGIEQLLAHFEGKPCKMAALDPQTKSLTDPGTPIESSQKCADPVLVDIAPRKVCSGSPIFKEANFGADKAVDGDDRTMFHSKLQVGPWWMIDLGKNRTIYGLSILPRQKCCHARFHDVEIRFGSHLKKRGDFSNHTLLTSYIGPYTLQEGALTYNFFHGEKGRYLSIKIVNGKEYLQINTIKIFGIEV